MATRNARKPDVSGPAKINLRAERLDRGLSIRAFAREARVHEVSTVRAESGEGISAKTAYAIATFYGFKVSELWDIS